MVDFSQYTVSDLSIFLIILIVAILALILTRVLLKLSTPYFFLGLVGLVLGLIVGSLAGSALSRLPGVYGKWLPIVVNIFTSVAVLDLFIAQAKPFADFLENFFARKGIGEKSSSNREIIVDTSILIDGRIEKIVLSGFLKGNLIVPKFILSELQNIADSVDPLIRAKGRYGLDVLVGLQRNQIVPLLILNTPSVSKREKIDLRLINLAKLLNATIITVDYNLTKIAQIENINVLNINELAEALKENFLPGEIIKVKISQKGKENNQGIGYLEDGTMVIIENGKNHIGKLVKCEIVRMHQTITGRMFFAELKN